MRILTAYSDPLCYKQLQTVLILVCSTFTSDIEYNYIEIEEKTPNTPPSPLTSFQPS